MLTNILATVVITLVTNVSDRFPMHRVQDPNPPGDFTLLYRFHYEPDANPDRKWTRTTVKRVTTLKVEAFSVAPIVSEEIVSDTEVEFKIKRQEDWIPAATNDIPRGAWFDQWGGQWHEPWPTNNWQTFTTNSVAFRTNTVWYNGDITYTNGVLVVTNKLTGSWSPGVGIETNRPPR